MATEAAPVRTPERQAFYDQIAPRHSFQKSGEILLLFRREMAGTLGRLRRCDAGVLAHI